MNYLDMEDSLDIKQLQKVADSIKSGGIAIFPTETVYGIGTNGLNSEAVKEIYDIKERNMKNPINLLVSNIKMIEKIAENISPLEYKLMDNFFPGPFTLILKKKRIVPDIVTSGLDFVGIRMPSGKIAKLLVELANVPIAAPSANISGRPSGTNFNDIFNDFYNKDKIDYIINGGKSNIGIESTIVKVIDDIPHILRPGFITPEQIKNIAGNVILENQSTNLPNRKLNHYQLSTNSVVVYSKDNEKMVDKICSLCKNYTNPTIVCCKENSKYYHSKHVICMGSRYNLQEISKNIFSVLRKSDSCLSDIIIIEGIKKEDIGIAIMNRLINVCNNNYIEIY